MLYWLATALIVCSALVLALWIIDALIDFISFFVKL